jgi:hypothetical protein
MAGFSLLRRENVKAAQQQAETRDDQFRKYVELLEFWTMSMVALFLT